MRIRFAFLVLVLLVLACAPAVDVTPQLADYDDYSKDLRAVATDPQALATLDAADAKRAEAAALVEKGKKKEAQPLIEEALADARLAAELDGMGASQSRAEKCLVEVEQARTKYSEALYVLQQTEEFTKSKASYEKQGVLTEEEEEAPMPASTLGDSIPPATIKDLASAWSEWRKEASDRKVSSGDLESVYKRNTTAPAESKPTAAEQAHRAYLATRATQSLEARVRTSINDEECVDAAQLASAYADEREAALRAVLELERNLQADLRRDLEASRKEAKSRQDELYNSLSTLQGKFASIRRDARGTIVSLADILFDFDKATLRRDVEFNLVKIATILNQYAEMKVAIEGHTDSIGTEEYNLGLSQRRAQAVYEFMISQGVAKERLTFEGFGETRPVADNDTDANRQKNRRVDLVIQDAPQ